MSKKNFLDIIINVRGQAYSYHDDKGYEVYV